MAYKHRTGHCQCFLSPFSRTNGAYCPCPLTSDSWGGCTGQKIMVGWWRRGVCVCVITFNTRGSTSHLWCVTSDMAAYKQVTVQQATTRVCARALLSMSRKRHHGAVWSSHGSLTSVLLSPACSFFFCCCCYRCGRCCCCCSQTCLCYSELYHQRAAACKTRRLARSAEDRERRQMRLQVFFDLIVQSTLAKTKPGNDADR